MIFKYTHNLITKRKSDKILLNLKLKEKDSTTKTKMTTLELSMNQVLKDAERVHEYRGDDTYALTSFLREVDTIFELIQSFPDAKNYIYKRVILNKLQGQALCVLRGLGPNANWEETKAALISNFGVKETYHQLYQDAFALKNTGIVKYFSNLRDILSKLNEKFEYDSEKPIEFSPSYVEKIILKTFISNIDVNLASVIINRNITNLREAFNLLEREGLIRNEIEDKKINVSQINSSGNKNRNQYKNFNNYRNNNGSGNYQNNNNNYHRTFSGGNRFSNNQGFLDNRMNSYPHNGNQNRTNNSGNFNRGSYQSRNTNVNSGRMEVDHIQEIEENYETEEQVNFLTTASLRHFQ